MADTQRIDSKRRRCLTSYLAKSFAAVSLTAPKYVWQGLDYRNLLFSVKMEDDALIFRSSYFNHLQDDSFIEHPLPYLADYLGYEPYSPGPHKLVHEGGDLWTFHSACALPTRWLNMIADFSYPRHEGRSLFKVSQSEEKFEEQFKTLVYELSEEKVAFLCQKIYEMMEYNTTGVLVRAAPAYTLEEYKEALEWDYQQFNKYRMIGGEKELLERKWVTGDCRCTPGVLMFFRQVNEQRYTSFYGQDRIYDTLAACEGGISLYYARASPWTSYRQEMILGGNSRHDIRYNPYRARKDIPVEEIVILGEALRMAGADIQLVK